jgi:hypothetical protein
VAWRRHQGDRAIGDPSKSGVCFYLGRGFLPTADPHEELFVLEPEDVHLCKALQFVGRLLLRRSSSPVSPR